MSPDETSIESTLLASPRPSYDPATGTYSVSHDWKHIDSILITLIDTISDVTGQAQDEMEPLHTVLDSGALSTLLSTSTRSNVHVSFGYQGCEVTISSDGTIVVDPAEESQSETRVD